MNLHRMLLERAANGNPLRIGLIGAGKFGAMYLSQIPTTPGIHLLGIADLSPARAKENLARLGWKPDVTAAGSFAEAKKHGNTFLTDDWRALVSHPEIDVVVESTGDPIAAVEHALEAFRNGKHVVMVTVEADAFCGPLLAKRAAQAGVVYSLAYGDQPALICELVDWARTSGFQVVAAGRGHKWLPHYGQSTPETVWGYYGLTPEQAEALLKETLAILDAPDLLPLFGPGSPGLDSADALQLVVALDKNFGLKVPDPGAAKEILASVNSMAAAIEHRRSGTA